MFRLGSYGMLPLPPLSLKARVYVLSPVYVPKSTIKQVHVYVVIQAAVEVGVLSRLQGVAGHQGSHGRQALASTLVTPRTQSYCRYRGIVVS